MAQPHSLCIWAQKPLANLLRVALIFPVYVPLFGPKAGEAGGAAWIVYDNILKVQNFFISALQVFLLDYPACSVLERSKET